MNENDYKLKQRQMLPLEAKVRLSEMRIREWHKHWGGMIYVSFSGGKDSTVLLDIVRNIYPDIPGVFFDTGLEYSEIRDFVKTKENITWIRPKKNFREVINEYGYPVISKETSQYIEEIRTTKSEYLKNKRLFGDNKGNGKISEKWKYLIDCPFKISHRCCYWLKKQPAIFYEKNNNIYPIIGTMANESFLRRTNYKKYGCNSFQNKRPKSNPLSVWLEEDIWKYIETRNLNYCSLYDIGIKRTGCMFCMFGVHLEEEPNRFQRMQKSHPKQWNYCINKLDLGKILDYINVPYTYDCFEGWM